MLYLVKGAQTGLNGPHTLSFDSVVSLVKRFTPGVFALGHMDGAGCFLVERVGRSDYDLRQALLDCIGTAPQFKFLEMPTADQAFAKECLLFHDFKPPGNRFHPEPPFDSERDCPRCFFPFHGG